MSEVLAVIDGVSCQVCGAVRALRGPTDLACKICWNKFESHREKAETGLSLEDDFARWLARQLYLDLRRLERTGIAGRCEAVSDWLYGNAGYQCGLQATTKRGGFVVCGRHGDPRHTAQFVTLKSGDAYRIMEKLLRRLAKHDPRFAAMLSRV